MTEQELIEKKAIKVLEVAKANQLSPDQIRSRISTVLEGALTIRPLEIRVANRVLAMLPDDRINEPNQS